MPKTSSSIPSSDKWERKELFNCASRKSTMIQVILSVEKWLRQTINYTMTDYVARIIILYSWLFLFTQSNRRLPPLIRSETEIRELQELSATSLEICFFSQQPESLGESVPHALYGISSLLKFSKQVLKAKLKIHRPSLVLTSNVDILRLNGVIFLPKYLTIRLTVFKILYKHVTMSAMNLEYPACWPLLTQQENHVSQQENSQFLLLTRQCS